MKLILCRKCQDVVKCLETKRTCSCGKSWGQYHDNIQAEYGGEAIPLGFGNHTLLQAVRMQAEDVSVNFDAFVIGRQCWSFQKKE